MMGRDEGSADHHYWQSADIFVIANASLYIPRTTMSYACNHRCWYMDPHQWL